MQVLLASFEPRRERSPTGRRFVQKPTRHASSRQFESQPTETPGRYEPTLNARPDPPSGRSVRVAGLTKSLHDLERRWSAIATPAGSLGSVSLLFTVRAARVDRDLELL